METVSIDKAKSRFSELISRTESGERFVIYQHERPAAVLINPLELDRLERISKSVHELALSLGQKPEILGQIEAGQLHPAMAASGLWQEVVEMDFLTEEVYANRLRQPVRAGVAS